MKKLKPLIVVLVLLFVLISVASAERVIVILEDIDQIKQAKDLQTLKTFVLEYQQDIMMTIKEFEKQGKVRDVKQLWIVNAIAIDASPEVIEELKKRRDVKKIIPDYEIKLLSEKTSIFSKLFNFTQEIKEQSSEEIAWNIKWIGADKVWKLGINGSGVNVSVVDSGIAPHPDLKDKIVAWKDFVNNKSEPYDDNGHGTHVAGIIAGTKTGVAPGANLIGVKVFDQNGSANVSTVLAGFQWSVEHGADIISYSGGRLPIIGIGNLSFIHANSVKEHTIYVNSSVMDDAFKPAFIIAYVNSTNLANLSISLIAPNGSVVHEYKIDQVSVNPKTAWLYKYMEDKPLQPGNWTLRIQSTKNTSYYYGLIVVYPSDGTSLIDEAVNNIVKNGTVVVVAAGNYGFFGLRTISTPGSASKAITVGATGYKNDSIALFSSKGPVGWNDSKFIKPDIVAPGVGINSTYINNGYAYKSGTSMATPHVSGVVALMLQANSSLTPDEIKQILKGTALDLGKPGEDNIYGAGRVNAYAAVRAVLNVTSIYVPDDYETIQEAINNASKRW